MTIRVGLIGAGIMGADHARLFAEDVPGTALQFICDAEGVQRRVLLITSSVPGEGKSTSTLSLALSLAEAGHRVALIDADLRKPCVAEMLGLEDSLGLTDLLVNRVGLEDVMQSVGDNRRLWVLPSGRVPPNPAELLGSPQFEELLTRFKNLFDYVIIDSPPVLPVSDAIVLSRSVDGVLLVAAIETVRRPQLETCVQTLERVGAPVIGVIANRLALGMILTITGLISDLAESAMKRSAGFKDSGALIPGHGGMLDRLDSLLFTGPAFYYYVTIVNNG